MDLAQPTYETVNHINAAIVQAMELCPRPELLSWGRRWISGDDRSQEPLAPIAAPSASRTLARTRSRVSFRRLGRRALMPDEMVDWTTKGAVLAALEWTRADPRIGSYHEKLAGRVAFLASLMGETWKAHQQYKGARERNHADSRRSR